MKEKRILILYTGGTIGMARSKHGYVPQNGYLEELMRQIPELHHEDMPQYEILVFDPLLDSSNIKPQDWSKIVGIIKRNYDQYDGFIVLHGTDTMSFTASAVSFMIDGLDKNVIFTGSQIPLCEIRNDAREHIITSLMICASYNLKEVTLYFKNKLLRACRSSKVNANSFNAFFSPNSQPLLTVGIKFDMLSNTNTANIDLKKDNVRSVYAKLPVRFYEIASPAPRIAVLKLFPGIDPNMVYSVLDSDVGGVVIEAYGAGNGPVGTVDFKRFFDMAAEKEIVSLMISQCLRGSIALGAYGTSLAHDQLACGYDMTFEAALAKMYFVLSLDVPYTMKVIMLSENLRGELNDC